MKVPIIYIFILLLFAGFRSATAQGDGEFREKIDDLRKKKLLEELDLPGDKTEAFMKIYDSYMDKERNLHREKRGAFKKLVHMSALGEEMPDKSIMKTLDLVNEIDMKIVSNHVAFVKDMEKTLNPAEIARVIVFEQNFQMKMREKVFDIRNKKQKMKKFMIEPPPFFEDDLE